MGLYYLQSRYYDANIGRFINADKAIADVGGEILGYNMYAYGFNNPINTSDSSGTWPKILKEIGARFKYMGNFFGGFFGAVFNSFSINIGVGIGIGVNLSGNVKGVNVEVGASTSISDSLGLFFGKFDVKNTTSTQVGLGVADVINWNYSKERSHSFFDEKCICNIVHDPFVEQSKCPANIPNQGLDTTIGLSVSLYIFLGFDVTIGINYKKLQDDLINVFTMPYEGYY